MRLIVLVMLPFLFIACTKKEKSKTIHGRIRNSENSWIALQKITDNGDETIDSVLAEKDGSFELPNPAVTPEFYILRANPSNLIFLFLKENDNVEINGDAKNLEQTYKIRGSKDSELIQKLRNFDRTMSDSLNKKFEELRAENPEKKDSIGMHLQNFYTSSMESYAKDFIRNNMSSIVSLSATKFLNQHNELKLMNDLKDSLLKIYSDNRYVKDYVILMDKLNLLPPGSQAPDISYNTPDGKPFSLSSLKGKIVLIDFWASWCSPCRKENPHLVEMYKKYKSDDFEIFGVSLDDNIDAWKNAITKDGITWPQVSELKKWESKVVKDFHIEAIPYSVLIDRDGRIIAIGIRSDELEVLLIEALAKTS